MKQSKKENGLSKRLADVADRMEDRLGRIAIEAKTIAEHTESARQLVKNIRAEASQQGY